MKLSLATLAVALAVSGAAAWAEDAMPSGPAAPGATAVADPKTDPKAEAKPRPVADDIISPEAAAKVDEEDLIKKLTGEDKADNGGPEKKFAEIIERMGTSESLLKKTDPGEVTQEIQRRIVTDLDVLIEMAKKSESQSSQQQKQQGQKKQESKGNQQGKGSSMGGTNAAQSSQFNDGDATAAPNAKDIHEVNQNEIWKNLPPRDRDSIINGMREEVLPGYQRMMERYYEELAKGK
jgi:hypothetical protein